MWEAFELDLKHFDPPRPSLGLMADTASPLSLHEARHLSLLVSRLKLIAVLLHKVSVQLQSYVLKFVIISVLSHKQKRHAALGLGGRDPFIELRVAQLHRLPARSRLRRRLLEQLKELRLHLLN